MANARVLARGRKCLHAVALVALALVVLNFIETLRRMYCAPASAQVRRGARRLLDEQVAATPAPVLLFPTPHKPPAKASVKLMAKWLAAHRKADQARRRAGAGTFPPDADAAAELLRGCSAGADASIASTDAAPPRRRAVVVLPAGDSFNETAWLQYPDSAPFDLVLLHYGTAPPRCERCALVMTVAGAKWRLAHDFALSPSWRALQAEQQYDYLMVPDDDLVLPQCAIAAAFAAARTYRLTLAQPSLCPAPGVFSPYTFLYRNGARYDNASAAAGRRPESAAEIEAAAIDAVSEGGASLEWHGPAAVDPSAQPASAEGADATAVRLVNFVEVMAPIFEVGFWEQVAVPSLWQSYFGTGMDSTWPTLLAHPRASIGVVDAACMRHYAKPRGAPKLLYALPTPHGTNRAEEAATWQLYNVSRNLGWVQPHVHRNITWADVRAAAAAAGGTQAVPVVKLGGVKEASEGSNSAVALTGAAGAAAAAAVSQVVAGWEGFYSGRHTRALSLLPWLPILQCAALLGAVVLTAALAGLLKLHCAPRKLRQAPPSAHHHHYESMRSVPSTPRSASAPALHLMQQRSTPRQ